MSLLKETISAIVPQDAAVRAQAHKRLEALTMPHWALGRLLDLAEDLAGITRAMHPPIARKAIFTMAADHGVVAEGVSKYPQEVTPQMVYNFVAGGAGINALARQVGASVTVVDMGVAADLCELADAGKIVSRRIGPGTKNMARGPAMSRKEAIQAVEAGIDCARKAASSVDVFGTGDMGIGNTTPSSAIVAVFSGVPVKEVTGHGTGIDAGQFSHKVSVIERALAINAPDPNGRPGRPGQGGRLRDRRDRRPHPGRRCAEETGRRGRLHLHRRGAHRPRALPHGRRVHDRRPPQRGEGPPRRPEDPGETAADRPRPPSRRGDGGGAGDEFPRGRCPRPDRGGHFRRGKCLKGESMKQFLAALQFLTIIPLPGGVNPGERVLGGALPFFPVVGLLIGAAVAGAGLGIGADSSRSGSRASLRSSS